MHTTRKQIPLSTHDRRSDPLRYDVTCILGHLKLHRLRSFALNNGNPIANSIANGEIVDPQADEIAPAQLAIDGKIKQSKVSQLVRKFEPGANGPDLLWLQWPLLSD